MSRARKLNSFQELETNSSIRSLSYCRKSGCTNPQAGTVKISINRKGRAGKVLSTRTMSFCEEHTVEIFKQVVSTMEETSR
jgi:hypothetical protein